ncbi:hypothetical protein [Rudaeicoccus suwonensis]|uniref:Uncharacterized protein n=1 Tax=Rudaeicoccus suwonensis TaxID=657409 RepID=A0A561DWX1_9MICO|nr:hypothetical protein [Rudaeicoccus suwonensis]TWE07854.1 hypothetical protein BKA23_3221 [Rudaeicoccus suwonensis]
MSTFDDSDDFEIYGSDGAEVAEIRVQLRAALTDAMHERDAAAVAAYRSALAALDNAEAVPCDERAGAIEDSPGSVGATEAPRRVLTGHEVQYLIAREVDEREAAAASYDRLGQPDRAQRLRDEADALTPWTT